MNIQVDYTLEIAPGVEIELQIGGEVTPAGRATEYDQWQGASVQIDWIQDGEGRECQKSGFTRRQILDMEQALLDEAAKPLYIPGARSFGGVRNLLNLPAFEGKKDFVG